MADRRPSPENTTEAVRRNPTLGLVAAMPGGIKAQERAGQRQLVNSDTLPVDIGAADKSALEAAGVVFGAQVSGDPLFAFVTLPDGWKKVATDHDMWSDLLDNHGKKRAEIFYKAAFYDRSAFMRLARDESSAAPEGAPI